MDQWVLTGTRICLQLLRSMVSCSIRSVTWPYTACPVGKLARCRLNSLFNSLRLNTKCFRKMFRTKCWSSGVGALLPPCPLWGSVIWESGYPLTVPFEREPEVSMGSSESLMGSCLTCTESLASPEAPGGLDVFNLRASNSLWRMVCFSWALSFAVLRRWSPLTWTGSGINTDLV